jgi:hypothetical protein
MVKYLSFHNSSFASRYFLMSMARPQFDTPLVYFKKFHDGARLGRFRFNWQLFFIELLKVEAVWHEWDIVLINPGSLSQFGGFFF